MPYKYKNEVTVTSTQAPVGNVEGAFIVKNKADAKLMKKKTRPYLTDVTVNYYGEERANPIRVYYALDHRNQLSVPG